jgi:hypothetical protein
VFERARQRTNDLEADRVAQLEAEAFKRQKLDEIGDRLCVVVLVGRLPAPHSLPLDELHDLNTRVVFVVDAMLPSRAPELDAQIFVPTLDCDRTDVVARLLAARIDVDAVFETPDACIDRLATYAGGNLGDLMTPTWC